MSLHLRETFCKEVRKAREHLSNLDAHPDETIHEARRHLKKARSILKLVRSCLGDRYYYENARLRGIARRLALFRDAAAMIEAFDEFGFKRFPRYSNVRAGLVAVKADIENAADLADVRQRAAKALTPGREWPAEASSPAVVEKGLRLAWRRGKRALVSVHSTPMPECFHDLRKRVKTFRFQLRFCGVENEQLDALDTCLGNAHNLAVLEHWIAERPTQFGSEADVAAFRQLLREKRVTLQAKALTEADRLFAGPRPQASPEPSKPASQ